MKRVKSLPHLLDMNRLIKYHGTVSIAIFFAYTMKYKQILFVGHDLFSSKYAKGFLPKNKITGKKKTFSI